ncbi:hypothetical protein BC831DRAFT_449049 [Entophlyctis helioformis]|nr:hypothetical protein BC831DRAFT_449049 [Entophlyctis helioformis]
MHIQAWLSLLAAGTAHARMLFDFQVPGARPVSASKQHQQQGAPPGAQAQSCSGLSRIGLLPDTIEPSDLAWQPLLNQLFLVSDNGQVLGLTVDPSGTTSAARSFRLKGLDLEAVAVVPSKPDVVYLGVERPPAIVEFNLTSESITASISISSFLDTDPPPGASLQENQGLESLVFVPEPGNGSTGHFLVGRQQDARLFVFKTDTASPFALEFIGAIDPVGPGKDLSALTLWRSQLWMLYDKPKELHAVAIADLLAAISTAASGSTSPRAPAQAASTKQSRKNASLLPSSSIGTLAFDVRGQEGIAFVTHAGSQQEWVFVAVDAPHKNGRKDLLQYEVDTFFICFAPHGLQSIPPA